MKLAFVVQRYGPDIIGGAEYFTRQVAERLQKYHSIEILTTCAKEYHTWDNEHVKSCEYINGLLVRRFKSRKKRDMNAHIAIQEKVFLKKHTIHDENTWIIEQGPYCPDLVKYIEENKNEYDYFIFFSYRYFPSYFGAEKVADKAIIVPFAENDPALDLIKTTDLFNTVAGIIYSTPEEREIIGNRVHFNETNKIWDIIGCGIEIPPGHTNDHGQLRDDYILYLGRIEGSKGCYQLFDFYQRLIHDVENIPELVLAGYDAIGIPKHKKIKYLGFVSEEEKYNLLRNAKFLIVPSPYESFSLVTLESMACGTPVVVNGECDVLKGHCIRSNAGLWYQNYEEFKEIVNCILSNLKVRENMGKNGIRYVENFYSWNIIEKKYITFLNKFKN